MKRTPLLILFFTIFLDMLGFGILIPVVPVLFTDPLSPHYLLPLGISPSRGYVDIGILTALYAFGQFIAAPIIGQFSDKFGRRKLLALSIFGGAIGYSLFAFGILLKLIPLLFIARLFSGLAGGNIVVAQAAIADLSTPADRTKNFGLIGAAFGLGFIIGPFIGGILADPSVVSWFNATTPFWFASILAFTNFAFILSFLPETNQHMRPDFIIQWGKSLKNITKAFMHETLRPLFVTNFLFQMGWAFYVTFVAVFLLHRYALNEVTIGNYFAYVGVWIVFTQGVMTRMMSKRFSSESILKNSFIFTGVGIIAMLLSPNVAVQYLIVPFSSIAIGLSQANFTALLSRSGGPTIQGEILGLNGSVVALAQTLPPLLSGFVAARFSPDAPLLVSAIIIILSGLYFINHLRYRAKTA